MYHETWMNIFDTLESSLDNGILLFRGRKYYPCNMIVVADTQEAYSMTLVLASNRTNMPCRYCKCPSRQLSNMDAYYDVREEGDIINAFNTAAGRSQLASESLHTDVRNAFWGRFVYGIYGSTPFDLLHLFDLGICKYVVDWTCDSLSPAGQKKLDEYFSDIPTYNDGKYFMPLYKIGITELHKKDAKDYRTIIQLIPFILTTDYEFLYMSEQDHRRILEVYQSLNNVMRCLRTRNTYNDATLEKLRGDIRTLARCIKEAFPGKNASSFNFVKFHSMIHLPEFIKLYGVPQNYNSEAFEQSHKHYAKLPYLRTNKHFDHTKHMKRRMDRISIVNELLVHSKTYEAPNNWEVRHKVNARKCSLNDSSVELPSDLSHKALIELVTEYLENDLVIDNAMNYINSNDSGIHFSATFYAGQDRFTVNADPNYKGYGPKYDDIEILHRTSRSYKWFAELRTFVSLPAHGKTLAIVRNYRNLGQVNALKCIRLEFETIEDQKFTVLELSNLNQKVHIIPDFADPGFYFYNDIYF